MSFFRYIGWLAAVLIVLLLVAISTVCDLTASGCRRLENWADHLLWKLGGGE